ncbi:MAG TPA: 3-isopropylmalate dehydrogenase [Ktedonobacterales bacterium]
MGTYHIAVLGGDGIGPEVTAEAAQVLRAVGQRFGHSFECTEALCGARAVEQEGAAISEETMALCQQSDAVLFGAVGGTKPGDPGSPKQPENALFRLRKECELFANLRPVKVRPGLLDASTIKPDVLEGVDLIVVRELTGGLYFGKPSEIRQGANGMEAIDTLFYSEYEIERAVRMAFELARHRRKSVTSVDKANVLSSSRLWRQVAERVAADYPDMTLTHLLVDACAMNLVSQPKNFDILVMENMFGDILTDEASMLVGSLGMLPSASLGTRRTAHGVFGLYEPIHGTAPQITGQGIANPLGAISSMSLLLRYSCGLLPEADAVEEAVDAVLAAGYHTADLRGDQAKVVGSRRMGELTAEHVLG